MITASRMGVVSEHLMASYDREQLYEDASLELSRNLEEYGSRTNHFGPNLRKAPYSSSGCWLLEEEGRNANTRRGNSESPT